MIKTLFEAATNIFIDGTPTSRLHLSMSRPEGSWILKAAPGRVSVCMRVIGIHGDTEF